MRIHPDKTGKKSRIFDAVPGSQSRLPVKNEIIVW
jgi:hypothetical protein